MEYKVDGKKVKWFNGHKWLVKETFTTNAKAEILLEELEAEKIKKKDV